MGRDDQDLDNYIRHRFFYRDGQLFARHRGREIVIKTIDQRGYLFVWIGRRRYKVHNIIWFLCHGYWPTKEIDHINRVKTDNRIENLRDVDRITNSHNRSDLKGLIGINLNSNTGKWQVHFRGKYYGSYSLYCQAFKARNGAWQSAR